jgi:uncharacterized protein (DUF305 family)
VLLPLLCAAACHGAAASRPPLVQPGAPGEASRVIASSETPAPSASRVSDADVRFMQGMIGHHAQAIEMTALLATRSTNPDMRLLAQRIEVSQADEIAMMRAWLEAHGQDVPGPHAHHAHGATLMPGMLTAEEMGTLAAARGAEFDRLFLQYMIRHHDGALIMVKDLFAQPGAAQDSEMFAFASDVDADQRMEIVRMSGMLKELVK